MNIEIINTGGELMLGRTLNTHAQWLARQLADRGLVVTRQTSVADTSEHITQAVQEALSRAGLVITTGGLGPTSDDLTREALAQMLGRKLQPNAEVAAHIQHWFESRNLPVPVSTRAETFVPEGAIVLHNANGTAPGLVIEITEDGRSKMEDGEASRLPSAIRYPPSSLGKRWLVMLPGPPRELRPMFTTSVVPLLEKIFHAGEPFTCRTFRTFGIGEAMLAERVGPKLAQIAGLETGYCAHMGQVDVRLEARGAAREKLLQAGEAVVRGELGENIFGMDDDSLEGVIIHTLAARKQTLALAESCTGGFIAHKLTNVPGASAVLLAGLVTYSNAAKKKFLGVREETLAAHGAVSEAVARAMAEGARREAGADFALAVTGIAGPGGGTAEKPVGTVFIALASAEKTIVLKKLNAYDRETFKELTARHALGMLLRKIRD